MSQRLKSIFTVSISVLGSRVLGLLRDSLTAAFLGVSTASNAFLFAFMMPNLFRRLFGEGALTSAFVPVLSDHVQRGNEVRAFRFVNQILLRLSLFSLGLAVLFAAAFLVGGWVIGQGDPATRSAMAEQWRLGCVLSSLMIFYMPMICVTAILGSVLNVRGRFAVPALSNVLLNIGMIAALVGGGWALKLPTEQLVWLVSIGVLAGGVLQIISAMIALWNEGWRPKLEKGPVDGMEELKRLFIPGLWGAAIMQINILTTRALAFGLNETATTTLNYAHRLIELPMGIFAVAIATVIFPQMSQMVSANDRGGLVESFGHGLRMTLALTAPAAIGLIVLHRPILQLLFQWGRFSAEDVAMTGPLLIILASAVPLFAVNAFLVRTFHAFKDTRSPVNYSVVAFAVNLIVSLVLMFPLQAVGLAVANLLSAVAQSVLLVNGIKKKRPELGDVRIAKALTVIIMASLGMAAVAISFLTMFEMLMGQTKQAALWTCGVVIPLGAGIYFALLLAQKFEDGEEVLRMLKRFTRRG